MLVGHGFEPACTDSRVIELGVMDLMRKVPTDASVLRSMPGNSSSTGNSTVSPTVSFGSLFMACTPSTGMLCDAPASRKDRMGRQGRSVGVLASQAVV